MKETGIDISGNKPVQYDPNRLYEFDRMIYPDNLQVDTFSFRCEEEQWPIRSPEKEGVEVWRAVRDEIWSRMEHLVKEMEQRS